MLKKPASTTKSQSGTAASSAAAKSAVLRLSNTNGTPAASACCLPAQSRSAITAFTWARISPRATASSSAFKLLPLPEINTTKDFIKTAP